MPESKTIDTQESKQAVWKVFFLKCYTYIRTYVDVCSSSIKVRSS